MCKNKCENKCNEVCGCNMKLSTKCIIYEGKDLPNIGITNGDNLENVLINIEDFLNGLSTPVLTYETFVEEFVGQTTINLSQLPHKVLMVFHESVKLPNSAWAFTAPNTINLILGNVGITMGLTDTITIVYQK